MFAWDLVFPGRTVWRIFQKALGSHPFASSVDLKHCFLCFLSIKVLWFRSFLYCAHNWSSLELTACLCILSLFLMSLRVSVSSHGWVLCLIRFVVFGKCFSISSCKIDIAFFHLLLVPFPGSFTV